MEKYPEKGYQALISDWSTDTIFRKFGLFIQISRPGFYPGFGI
jgi:hypothetical protein